VALFTSDAFAGGWSKVCTHRAPLSFFIVAHFLSKVASSDLFFAYGLFGGQIRLQSARSTSRLLLQCDSGAVTDLKVRTRLFVVPRSLAEDLTLFIVLSEQADFAGERDGAASVCVES
jgi:hypothetical protein